MNRVTKGLLASTALLFSSAAYAQDAKDAYLEFEQKELLAPLPSDSLGAAALPSGPTSSRVVISFDGVSQYDVAAVGRNFIPPDTMGAVGTTQYMETTNGGYAVYNKATGARTSFVSDVAFWASAGQTGANGDSRVMFNAATSRWVAISFGSSVSDIQIAVSATADATGAWSSTKFTGFTGGTADFPTLAMDTNAIYIGTNNFSSSGSFAGTSLNVIPLSDIFGSGAPTAANRVTFSTPYVAGSTTNGNGGYAIQGVNSTSTSTTGMVTSTSLFDYDQLSYNVLNAGKSNASLTTGVLAGENGYLDNSPGRQPNAVPDTTPNATFTDNSRVIDTGDDRIASSVYETGGKIYSVRTETPLGSDYTTVHWTIVDSVTKKVLAEGDVGDATHDYYAGSLAVNALGQVVIGYDRSGSNAADGNITVAARIFNTVGNGLVQIGGEEVLHVSSIDDYHNGTVDGVVASGRQRWGDYSSVSLDPTDPTKFWVIGEYAREYNDAAGGHPGGTGGSRWGTWIAEIDASSPVPEPATWLSMILGFGMIGFAIRFKPRPMAATQG